MDLSEYNESDKEEDDDYSSGDDTNLADDNQDSETSSHARESSLVDLEHRSEDVEQRENGSEDEPPYDGCGGVSESHHILEVTCMKPF